LPGKADTSSVVSWNWGGGAPGGKVAETKEHGDIAIQSKKGNTIKKKAEPGNPAVHVEHSGNNVVKKASELNVEEKASSSSKKREHKDDKDDVGDGPVTDYTQGKDVKKQKTEKKSMKTDKKNTKAAKEQEKKGEEKKEEEEENKIEEEATKTDTKADATPKKKAPGRPKGNGTGGAKPKKEPKTRNTDGVGSRTRSRA
jgi:Hypervirulence associated proteins TUDOR domain